MSKSKIELGALFERHEKKFLLDREQYALLLPRLEERMTSDAYGRYTICTLYCDTEDFAVIRRCRQRPTFRTKLRLRSYGVPAPGSTVYLELKKKLNGITYKRRVALAYEEAMAYLELGRTPAFTDPRDIQSFGEIDYVMKGQPQRGRAVICYDRLALAGVEDANLRLTIDANIRWRDYSLELSRGDHGALLLGGGERLMEIKTLEALPYWLCETLAELAIYPVSFSKYGTVYTQQLAGKEALSHVG